MKHIPKSVFLLLLWATLLASSTTSAFLKVIAQSPSLGNNHEPRSHFKAGKTFNPSPSNTIYNQTLEVLYESDRVVAIYKPSGIAHHGEGAGEATISDVGDDEDNNTQEEEEKVGIVQLLRRQRQAKQQNYIHDEATSSTRIETTNITERLFGVHRLDRVTSGILLFAKDAETAKLLTRLFREKEVVKYYVGLSAKKPNKKKQGWIKGNMVRSRRKSWRLTREEDGRSGISGDDTKRAKKNFAVTRFFSYSLSGVRNHLLATKESIEEKQQQSPSRNSGDTSLAVPKTMILFRPHTGKTHQLRVAAKSVGLALLGDPVYEGGATLSSSQPTQSNGKSHPQQKHSCCLHAAGLHVRLDDKETITIWCPPTRIFRKHWDSRGAELVEESLLRLLKKHCECDELLAAAT